MAPGLRSRQCLTSSALGNPYDAGTDPPVVARVDDTSVASLTSSFVPPFGSSWDVSDWDTSSWGPSTVPLARWQSVQGIGQVGSVILGITSQTPLTLNQIDILYEPGGVL
jgi:hypothetical protein